MSKKITNESILKYAPMVQLIINKRVMKHWKNDLRNNNETSSAGNTGWSIEDFKQELYTEVFIALKNYRNDKNTKESTFVYLHLNNKTMSLVKKLTGEKRGYGVMHCHIEDMLSDLHGKPTIEHTKEPKTKNKITKVQIRAIKKLVSKHKTSGNVLSLPKEINL